MCKYQERACQQRGENQRWREHLPEKIITHKELGLELRPLCPGCKGACLGNFSEIVGTVSQLSEEALCTRYFYLPKSIEEAELHILQFQYIVIGAYVANDNISAGLVYIAKGDANDLQKKVELAFAVRTKYAGQGIGQALLRVAEETILQVIGSCHIHVETLRTNQAMRAVMNTRGRTGKGVPDDNTVIIYDYVLAA